MLFQCSGHFCFTSLSAWRYDIYVCLMEFQILAAANVFSGWVLTCDSAQSWSLYSAAWLKGIAMTQYPTQSHYPDVVRTERCPILIMPSARLDKDRYQSCKSVVWLRWDSISWPLTTVNLRVTNSATASAYRTYIFWITIYCVMHIVYNIICTL